MWDTLKKIVLLHRHNKLSVCSIHISNLNCFLRVNKVLYTYCGNKYFKIDEKLICFCNFELSSVGYTIHIFQIAWSVLLLLLFGAVWHGEPSSWTKKERMKLKLGWLSLCCAHTYKCSDHNCWKNLLASFD